MKLDLSYQDLSSIFTTSLPKSTLTIESVAFDTRKIINGNNSLFFALKGEFRDGHEYINEAYSKGVRTFVVSKPILEELRGATFIQVDDPIKALQVLAKNHREQFSYPIVAITGSAGKTITKEWLSQLLGVKYKVIRSPKSYNSQLGVALSLLELNESADLAIIEAGISQSGEMDLLETMIQPTIGILTSIGSAHRDNFNSPSEHLNEKLVLFRNARKVFYHDPIQLEEVPENFQSVKTKEYASLLETISFDDEISRVNASMAIACAKEFDLNDDEIKEQLGELDRIALRLETFNGVHNSIIINDTYNLDLDAFRSSLEYQLSIAKGKDRVVIIGTDGDTSKIESLLSEFEPIKVHFLDSAEKGIETFENAVVLVKGKRAMHMERYALRLRSKKHQTYVEIDLNAIKNNISYFNKQLPDTTKILAMVKASSYGSGIEQIGQYLERIGINYLGVAYADEGVELRRVGVKTPILVMNSEEYGFEECIQHNLAPCIYSTTQLDKFVKQLIYEGKSNYPIHIKIETGMNRLGFQMDELDSLIEMINSQPEVQIETVYSHLANSDDPNSAFIHEQVEEFKNAISFLKSHINYSFECHILNSEGILNHPEYHFDMVRLGIGMYGYSSSGKHAAQLTPAVTWYSAISQIKKVNAGISIGYDRKGIADHDMNIAIIPVGYADGFKRSLSKGKGGVYIQNQFCPVVGNVCMDMIMVNLGSLSVTEGEPVQIIGSNQSVTDLADKMETIAYEVLTGISKRVHRVYLED
ncbi:MAG: alanine racemase [Crocinitomicaceae bacterium]|nr:alanine racemase [Crocinitomicaceae bacterium]